MNKILKLDKKVWFAGFWILWFNDPIGLVDGIQSLKNRTLSGIGPQDFVVGVGSFC